ncbi:hypothetical protein MNBD_CHLOROFLEXI01-2282, partial [hydrothermal vent metagenome]
MVKQWFSKNRLMLSSLLVALIGIGLLASCGDNGDEAAAPGASN